MRDEGCNLMVPQTSTVSTKMFVVLFSIFFITNNILKIHIYQGLNNSGDIYVCVYTQTLTHTHIPLNSWLFQNRFPTII